MMMVDSVNGSDLIDGFDRLPDPIVLHIFNKVSDIKTLIRCRCVSRRFNSLVPQTDSLLLRVDRVISAADPDFLDFHGGDVSSDSSSFLLTLLGSLLKPIHNLFASSSTTITKSLVPSPARAQSPTQILRCFERVRNLRVELPSGGGPKLDKGTCIKWKAAFGKTLKYCVIFAFRESESGGSESSENTTASGLKTRVVWTISALMAASARHYMILEAINEQKGIENLVIEDRECEGTVVMDKYGLQECREEVQGDEEEEEDVEDNTNSNNRMEGTWWRNNRTSVPAVRMRMRHEARIELSTGARMEGATLVVVRPINDGSQMEEDGDVELAMGAFGEEGGGVYAEAVQSLLKSRSYILEMNSF